MNFSISTEIASTLFAVIPVIIIASAALLTAIQQKIQKNN